MAELFVNGIAVLVVTLLAAELCLAQVYVNLNMQSSHLDTTGVTVNCDRPFLHTNYFHKIDVPVASQNITESCYCLLQPSVNTSSLEQLQLSVLSSPLYVPQTALNYQDWKDNVYGVPSFSVAPTQSSGPLFHIYKRGEQGFQRNGRTVIFLVFGAQGDSVYLNCSPHWYDGYTTTTLPTTSLDTTKQSSPTVSSESPIATAMLAGVICAVSAVFLIITIIFICVCLKLRKKAHRNKLPPIPKPTSNKGTKRFKKSEKTQQQFVKSLPADEDQFRQPEDPYDQIPDKIDSQYFDLDEVSKDPRYAKINSVIGPPIAGISMSPNDIDGEYMTPSASGESYVPRFLPQPQQQAINPETDDDIPQLPPGYEGKSSDGIFHVSSLNDDGGYVSPSPSGGSYIPAFPPTHFPLNSPRSPRQSGDSNSHDATSMQQGVPSSVDSESHITTRQSDVYLQAVKPDTNYYNTPS